jgi:hypothetical protein
MRSLSVVMLHPCIESGLGFLEALEVPALQELLSYRLVEALHLAGGGR